MRDRGGRTGGRTSATSTEPALRAPARFGLAALALAIATPLGCGQQATEPASDLTLRIPELDLDGMEARVRTRLRQTRAAVVAEPQSGANWGRFGMVAHAHELWEPARLAYEQAERLDPMDERWPYYRGDVLATVGTDLTEAGLAFRRAMALRPDYAPAHLRLGRVLLAAGQAKTAATELERALEIEPGLQPARVTLAQIRLSEGELEASEEMLEEILRTEPRHAQALSTLGQVYMRQGRRSEAREIAQRARGAALYNLYADPLMSPVVAEGASSVLLWERAKAYLDNGNYEQAALGLELVVELLPENADVHQQLAVAHGSLGDLSRSRHHLERAVALVPDRVDALIQLATVYLDQHNPTTAIKHLRRILDLDPNDPDARWLLGRAQMLAGDPRAALATFEEAEEAGSEVPGWARNEWGSALAQNGQLDAALEQFRAALAADEDDAQARFYIGLLFEGSGRVDEAVAQYCASARLRPDSPASARLQALGRSCR